jgi:hypothetical protein
MYRLANGEAAAVPVHDAVPLADGHPGPADQVRVALDGDDVMVVAVMSCC